MSTITQKKLFVLFSLLVIASLALTACATGEPITIGDQPPAPLEAAGQAAVENFTGAVDAACATYILAGGVNEIRPLIMEVYGHPVINCAAVVSTQKPVTNMSGLIKTINDACNDTHPQGGYQFTWNTILVDGITVPCESVQTNTTNPTLISNPSDGQEYLWSSFAAPGFFIVNSNNIPVAWIQNGQTGTRIGNVFTIAGYTGFVLDTTVVSYSK